MEYSIHDLSQLSGLSTRTLRWYDEIGLLKPSRVAESGYRYYGPAQVDRLQEILIYRSLGVELARIRDCLDAPSFDRLALLRQHLAALHAQKDRLEATIDLVADAIHREERRKPMKDDAKFAALKEQVVAENEAAYGQEARQRYGSEAVDAANKTLLGMNASQYDAWTALDAELRQRLESAVRSGLSPDSEEGQLVCTLHRRWLAMTDKALTTAKQKGIAELYVLDDRFKAYYDRCVPGCAQFLRDAVVQWAK